MSLSLSLEDRGHDLPRVYVIERVRVIGIVHKDEGTFPLLPFTEIRDLGNRHDPYLTRLTLQTDFWDPFPEVGYPSFPSELQTRSFR